MELKMPRINQVTISGNLTRDPEVKQLQKTMVCNLNIAVNKSWKNASGEWENQASFFGVKVWGNNAEACGQNLRKGSPVIINGELSSETWDDKKDGSKKSKTLIVSHHVQFLEKIQAQPKPAPSDGESEEVLI